MNDIYYLHDQYESDLTLTIYFICILTCYLYICL